LKDYKFISSDLSFLKRYPHIVNEQECLVHSWDDYT
jgi:DNA-directed RNA polymerase-3 subunit RPC5